LGNSVTEADVKDAFSPWFNVRKLDTRPTKLNNGRDAMEECFLVERKGGNPTPAQVKAATFSSTAASAQAALGLSPRRHM
jgi:hypothetical protein